MTLNGRTALCTNNASFGAHRGNLKEDRRILLAATICRLTQQLLSGGVSFFRIFVGFRGQGPQTTCGGPKYSEQAIFSNFSRHQWRIQDLHKGDAEQEVWGTEIPKRGLGAEPRWGV